MERGIHVLPVGDVGIDVMELILLVPTVGRGIVPLPLDGSGSEDEVEDQMG